jgi:hypothetical protein
MDNEAPRPPSDSKALFDLLAKRCGSSAKADLAVNQTRLRMGYEGQDSPVLFGMTLLETGVPLDDVAKNLRWQDFEEFCADLAKGAGFDVRKNVLLRQPRAQIDLVLGSYSWVASIDCKHWARLSSGGMRTLAAAQLRRSSLLRAKTLDDGRPIASAILTLLDPGERFANGVALVPITAFRDFLNSLDGIRDMLELL